MYVKTEDSSISYTDTLHEPRMEIKEEEIEDENCDIEIKDEPLYTCVHAGRMSENVFCNCKTIIPENYTKNERIANSHIYRIQDGQLLVEKIFTKTNSTPILQPLQGLNSTKPTLQLHQGQVVTQRQILQPSLQLPKGQLLQNIDFNKDPKTQSLSQVSQVINTKSTMQSQHGQVVLPAPTTQPTLQLSQGQFIFSREPDTLSTLKHRQVVLQEPKPQPSLQLSKVDLPQEPVKQSLMQLPNDQRLFLPKGGNLVILDEETNTQKSVQLQPGLVLLPTYKPNTKLTIAAPKTIFFSHTKFTINTEEQLLIQQPKSTFASLHNKTLIQQSQTLRDAKRSLDNTHIKNQINPKKLNNTGCKTFEKVKPKNKTILENQDLLKSTETVDVKFKVKVINMYSGNITENDTKPELKKDTETLPVYFNSDDYTNDTLYGKNSLISSKKDLNKDDLIRGAKMLDQHIQYYNNELGINITDQELYQHMKSKYNILKVQHDVGKGRFSTYHQFCRS